MPTARQLEFESLVAPHLNSLYSTALRMTHNQDDAEDLVQDTLFKAFRAFDQYQKNTNFRAWAFRILVNTYITAYRKAIRQPQKVSYDDLEEFYLYKKLDESISLQETAKEDFLENFFEDDVKDALDSTNYQNTNISVRVNDDFMKAVENDNELQTVPVYSKDIADKMPKYNAKFLLNYPVVIESYGKNF